MKYVKLINLVYECIHSKMVGKRKKYNINYGYYKEDLYIILDGKCMYRIPEKYNPFSTKWLDFHFGTPMNIGNFTDNLYENDRLSQTNHIDIVDKKELLLFRNENKDIWINKDFLKITDYGNNTRVYGKNEKSPLYFCESENDIFDYMILPVVRKEV